MGFRVQGRATLDQLLDELFTLLSRVPLLELEQRNLGIDGWIFWVDSRGLWIMLMSGFMFTMARNSPVLVLVVVTHKGSVMVFDDQLTKGGRKKDLLHEAKPRIIC